MRIKTSYVVPFAVVLAAATYGAPAGAANTAPGFALDRFNPSERGSDWFALDSLDFRGSFRPAIGIVGDYGYHPLVIYNADGSVRTPLIADELFVHVGASLNLWSRVRVAFDLPLAAWQDGTGGTIGGVTYPASNSGGVGDLRLTADLRLFGNYGDAFTVAAGMQTFVPTGSQSNYLGDGSVRLLPRAQVAGDLGAVAYAASLGFVYHNQAQSFGSEVRGSELAFAASIGLREFDKRLLFGPELYGTTDATSGGGTFFAKAQTPVEGLLGAHFAVTPDWRVGAGAGVGLTRGLGEPIARVVATVEWMPAIKKEEPPPPLPPADRDGDGIPDAEDACPDVAGVHTDDPKTNGCPPDRDHDGIIDAEDACPDVPGVRTEDPKTNGCPPDRDHDGIPDAQDACPDVPGVHTDDPKTNGCPPDRDHDGIPDNEDACPDVPGPRDPDPKKNGCPIARVEAGEVKIIEQIKFQTASAVILPESQPIVDAVVKVLKEHAEIKRVRVEGHTDSQGAAAMNLDLSKRRAASVVKALIAAGIDKGRLTSQGFGQTKPIDSNSTVEGRANNRRVEFHIEDDKK